MVWEFLDRDHQRAAVEAGYAPIPAYVELHAAEHQAEKPWPTSVEIPDDVWEEFERYAKRTNCKTETAILAALNEWLGRV